VAVEQRVIEEQARGRLEQRPRGRAQLVQRAVQIERLPDRRRRLVSGHGTVRHRFEELGELLHQSMAERAERRGIHCEGTSPIVLAASLIVLGAWLFVLWHR
jgi:hypothetical protein